MIDLVREEEKIFCTTRERGMEPGYIIFVVNVATGSFSQCVDGCKDGSTCEPGNTLRSHLRYVRMQVRTPNVIGPYGIRSRYQVYCG